MTSFEAEFSYTKLDPTKLADFLRGPDGPVYRKMIQDGDRVKERAKELVGVSPPDPVPRKKPRKPGNLRDHIVKRVVMKGANLTVVVGADVPYALWHHEGTVAHEIVAKPGKPLVFYWPKVGEIVRFMRVNHPGTKPNRFLVEALKVLRD